MKIGDEVYVHGYVDEIRNDVVIIRNEGGYFGTAEDEIICFKAEFHKEHIEPEVIIEPTDEPQTKTQMKTQNSNLTFEKRTMRDCYNCKRFETDDECIECHYEPKDEPQTDCETCKHYNPNHEAIACERCLDGKYSRYEPQTERSK